MFMSVMLLLLGASLLVGIIFLLAFIWSVKVGQLDDTYSPAHKIFFDDVITKEEKVNINKQITNAPSLK